MADEAPVAIPHEGRKPDWLEDDARVIYLHDGALGGSRTAGNIAWARLDGAEFFLPADHWAAPVLRLGPPWKPWNPKLQGEGPPKDYAGGKVMLSNGHLTGTEIENGEPFIWTHDFDDIDSDLIGYEPAPLPTTPATEGGSLVERFAPCPTCKGYHPSVALSGAAHDAFMQLTSMVAHPVRGHPMGSVYTDEVRNAAQVMGARITELEALLGQGEQKLGEARTAIIAAREQFDFYAAEHRKAGKHEKAGTNEKFAFIMSGALERTAG